MIDNKFGELISKLRKEMNLTQKELSDKLGISDKAISRWETGKNFPTIEMLYQISKFFKIPFNDLLTARMCSGTNEEDDVFPEIVKEFNSINKRKIRILRISLIVLLITVLVVIIVHLFSLNYNRFRVYDVAVQSDDLLFVKGTYVETRIKDVLTLANLNNLNISETDSVSVDIYFLDNDKENIIQSYTRLDNINFSNTQSYIKMDDLSKYIDNLYLRVKIIDKNNNIKEYSGKLQFVENFSNNKIYINDKVDYENKDKVDLTPEDIRKILLNNGFEEILESYFVKSKNNISIKFHLDNNILEYTYEENNINYSYQYNLNNHILEVSIFDNNNVELENYKYDNSKDEVIDCKVGRCKNYPEVMDVLNKNFLNLLKK